MGHLVNAPRKLMCKKIKHRLELVSELYQVKWLGAGE